MKKTVLMELIGELIENKTESVINTDHPFEIGEKYFIRTVTYHSTGKVKEIKGNFLILEKGAWIADSGRLHDALKKGFDKIDSAEIEPYGLEWIININSIIDACVYPFSLPSDQK